MIKDLDNVIKTVKNIGQALTSYTGNHIADVSDIVGIRNNPRMYLNVEQFNNQALSMFNEIIANSIDEFNQCRRENLLHLFESRIDIEYISISGKTDIQDHFRGIPIMKTITDENGNKKDISIIDKVVSTINSGGKTRSESNTTGYQFSIGMNGMGTCVTNAVSTYFEAISCRMEEGKKITKGRVVYKNGVKECEEYGDMTKDDVHGTRIVYTPDPNLLKNTTHIVPFHMMDEYLSLISYCNPFLEINLKYDGKKHTYLSTQGIKGFYDLYVKENNCKRIIPELEFNLLDPNMNFNLTAYLSVCYDRHTPKSFVNYALTSENGTHVSSLSSGICRAITHYMKTNSCLSGRYEKMGISGASISSFISGIVLLEHKNAEYSGQTKGKLISNDIIAPLSSLAYEKFMDFALNNKKYMDILVKFVIQMGEADYMAKQARDKVLGKIKKLGFDSDVDLTKYVRCESDDPDLIEVFLIEGDSALGNAKVGRNAFYQSLLALKGKVSNVLKTNDPSKLSEELKILINILGVGFGDTKDISKMKFNKVIIATDVDVDGWDIMAQLLTFFYMYYPELIEKGYIYRGLSPLKSIILKDGKRLDNHNKNNIKLTKNILINYSMYIKSEKTDNVISEGLSKLYVNGLIHYAEFMKNFKDRLSIDPYLLELVILNYGKLLKNDFKSLEKQGWNVTRSKTDENSFDFMKELDHYYLRLDHFFHKEVYIPLYNLLSKEVVLNSVYFESKKTGVKYKGSNYFYAEMIDDVFEKSSEGVSITYNKGLGSVEKDILEETLLNPKTRTIYRVTMKDAETCAKKLNLFMNNKNIEEKKEYFLNN